MSSDTKELILLLIQSSEFSIFPSQFTLCGRELVIQTSQLVVIVHVNVGPRACLSGQRSQYRVNVAINRIQLGKLFEKRRHADGGFRGYYQKAIINSGSGKVKRV